MAKPSLGRGLGALLGDPEPEAVIPATPPEPSSPPVKGAETAPTLVRRDSIRPCSFQPRREFGSGSLDELADSIRSKGILQPLVVRRVEDGYEIIAGERRWRAAGIAGLEEVPVVFREADQQEVIELALVENLQRENLNPIEEALGYRQLVDEYHLKQDQVAGKVGKNRATVTNALRLLRLADPVQSLLRERRISTGHAKVLLRIGDAARQTQLARTIAEQGLSVRETEERVEKLTAKSAGPKPDLPVDANIRRLEDKIRSRVGTRVLLRYREGKGTISLSFFSDEDLDRIVQMLGIESD